MNKLATAIVQTCIMGILILPSFAVLTESFGFFSLTEATVAVLLLAAIGALAAWWRVIHSDNLKKYLPEDVEAARSAAQFLIFPEIIFFGWKAPRILQLEWDKQKNKNVAALLCASSIKNLSTIVISIIIISVVIYHGLFHGAANQSRLELIFPFMALPIARAIEISFLCIVELVILNLMFCRNSALKLNHKGNKL